MLFNSIQFLIFFPVVILFYFVIPEKIRYLWLLFVSYFFYMCWNAKYALLILFSTVITYFSGLIIEKIKAQKWEDRKIIKYKKYCVIGSFILNLAILFWFKYLEFMILNLNRMLNVFHFEIHIPTIDIILPVGISFYTFQALSYTMDIYRDKIHAERNPFRYALFVSFFPQLVAGPIERSENLLRQLKIPTRFSVKNAEYGLLTMAYGVFLKVVVADNLSLLIDPVYYNTNDSSTIALTTGMILFAFQVYCDFQGYTQIAIGSARILGFQLNENFNSPYLAKSIKDFWGRWHISLTSWFRDYLYIPLGGNRKGKFRKQINTMLVFLCSGLWHGASWHYVIWGGANGIFSVLEDVLKPYYHKMIARLKINERNVLWKGFRTIVTFAMIDLTWLFFRVNSFREGIGILKRIFAEFRIKWFISSGFFNVFGTTYNFVIIAVSLLCVMIIDILNYNGIDVRKIIFSQQIIFRWIIYWMVYLIIIYWGVYGTGYEQTQFIYFQF